MKVVAFIGMVAILLSGCGISRVRVQNYNPNDYARQSAFYECLQQAQQIESTAGFAANQNFAAGSARTGAITNKPLLVACMESKGYQLRSMTGFEVGFTLVTLPLSIPFAILGADVNDFY
jgi:hypothetical protein